jgi:hypothetical protein
MQNISRIDSQCDSAVQLQQEREYLASLELVAHHARTSDNPAEVAAAIQSFARPSAVLKRLAAASRSLQ